MYPSRSDYYPGPGFSGVANGKRRILVACAVLMVAGSLVCALTDSLVPMVAGPTLQGLSAAVIPPGISVMRDVLPREKLSSSVALMSASLGVGGALGLPASAVIAEHWNWHMLFWVSVVLGVVVTVLVVLVVPESPNRAGGRLDVPGVVGLAAGLVALLVAITEGGTWGWTNPTTLGCFAGSVVVLLAWGVWELRTPSPVADLRTSARRQVLITNLASIVIGFGMYASSLIAPQVLELPKATGFGLGQSLVAAGMWMLPTGLVMMGLSSVAGQLIRRYGGMAAVPGSQTAAVNGLNSLMLAIGTSLASAVIAAILARMTIHLGGAVIPSATGFRVGLLAGAGGAVIAALVVLAIPRQQPVGPRSSPEGEATAYSMYRVRGMRRLRAYRATSMAAGRTAFMVFA
jgi:MFS family permease